MGSSSHKYSLIRRQGAGISYYNGLIFACLLRFYVSGLDFKVTFTISASFGIQTLFLNFNKTLFDLKSLCNRFLRCIYLTADARLKQITFQSALVNLFSFCMLETVTTLLFSHVINSITNFPSNSLKT